MRVRIAGWFVSTLAIGISGCQSWSQLGQTMPTGSRVPPPGTGTFQVPSSYYNSSNGAAGKVGSQSSMPSNTVQTASTTGVSPLPSTAQSANGGRPNNQLVGNSFGSPPGAVVTTADWQPPSINQLKTGVNNSANAIISGVQNRATQVVQASSTRASEAVQSRTNQASEALESGASRAAAAIDNFTDTVPSLRPPATASGFSANSTISDSDSGRGLPAARGSLSDTPSPVSPQLSWGAPQP